MKTFPHTRIIVVGTTSSGKSTLAENLAIKLGLDFVELDALYWQPNWVGTPDDEFDTKVDDATHGDHWVVAGNYSRTRPITWPRAEVIIWLDYSLPVIFWQLTRRTLRRTFTREVLWGTNVERLWPHLKFWSDVSLFKWLFKTYWRRKREYPALMAQPEHQHLKLIRFTSPRETQDWLEYL
ncbi:MAG: adenylate kinase [Anaerolineales bacterium]|uniref:Adenylate kinase n=1 Tax=Candidatus Desulfolinea nitratireducens TaxID=2841698 RepID=A0A8J6TJD8_9CHLR|nr:adenylate kinase [Candidatus Desulfolinea nitratireducens]MBL6959607.1 adenylate kinase [Anaerolineales bacterium]